MLMTNKQQRVADKAERSRKRLLALEAGTERRAAAAAKAEAIQKLKVLQDEAVANDKKLWEERNDLIIEERKRDDKVRRGLVERVDFAARKEDFLANQIAEIVRQRELEDLEEEQRIAVREAIVLTANKVVTTPIAKLLGAMDEYSPDAMYNELLAPLRLKNNFNNYFNWCETNDRIPSVKGLLLYCRMSRHHYKRYMESQEHRDIMESAHIAIAEWVERDIYASTGNTTGKVQYAKSILDWTEKTETKQTTNVTITVEEAKAKIESLISLIDPEIMARVASRYEDAILIEGGDNATI